MLSVYSIAALTFLTPLFFWTLTPNVFGTAKDFIFIILTLLVFATLIYRLIKHKDLTVYASPLTTPLIIFIMTILGSLLFNPEGRPEALAGKGMTLILLPLLSLIIVTFHESTRLTKSIINALLAATSLLSIHSLLSLSFLSRSAFIPTFMQNVSFTPTGSYLTTLTFIIIGLSLSIGFLKQTSPLSKNIGAALIVLHTIAIVAIVSLMLPGGSLAPSLLSYQASWSIGLDALKSLRSLLFGIGLSNYSLLYTAVKPLSVNLTPLWNAIPSTAASELLTLLPTLGFLGTMSFLFLMTKGIVWTRSHTTFLSFLLISFAFLIIPASLPLYLLFFLLLGLSAPHHVSESSLSKNVSRLLAGILLAFSIFVIITSGRSFASEFLIKRAQAALQAGNSQIVYDLHFQSIRLSPQITNYQLSFAEINFRLASALSQKKDLTDTDRETISRLIQQSINSNKAAISLRPNSATTWISLAKIYQNLINVAEGSDQFALESYARAVALDRANPLLRIEYGNLLSQLSTTQESKSDQAALRARAKAEFQTAIQLKSDYANAYFNLAKLYEAESDYPSAVAAMQQVVKYLDVSSADYNQAVAKLETLKAKLPKATPAPSASPAPTTELTEPSPLPSPLPGGPIELPQT